MTLLISFVCHARGAVFCGYALPGALSLMAQAPQLRSITEGVYSVPPEK
jgi:hypothetical protein